MAWAAGLVVGSMWAGYVKSMAGWETMAWSLRMLGAVTAGTTLGWMGGSIIQLSMKRKTFTDLGLREENNRS